MKNLDSTLITIQRYEDYLQRINELRIFLDPFGHLRIDKALLEALRPGIKALIEAEICKLNSNLADMRQNLYSEADAAFERSYSFKLLEEKIAGLECLVEDLVQRGKRNAIKD